MLVIRMLVSLLAFGVLAGTVAGDDAPPSPEPEKKKSKEKPAKLPKATTSGEIKVTLTPAHPSDKATIDYSKARALALETSAPRFLFEVPKFRTKEPLYFRVTLGETKGVPFYGALDESGTTGFYDLLYLDRNRDLDLSNDGEPLKAQVRTIFSQDQKLVEFVKIKLDLPYTQFGKEGTEPYSAVIFYMPTKKKRPITIQIERDGWREGVVEMMDGTKYRMVMVDDDSDGQYTTSDAWTLLPETTPVREMLYVDATRSMLFPSWNVDQRWRIDVKSLDAGGREATLVFEPAKENELAFFARIAKARQSPQERALDIDPLRPKATGTHKVDWIKGRDDKFAIQIAGSPNVNLPVLLFFGVNTNRMSVSMDTYTFRDREVVALSKRFVCARIDASKMQAVMKKYNVDAIPVVIVLTSKGVEIRRDRAGFRKPRDFAAFMKAALR